MENKELNILIKQADNKEKLRRENWERYYQLNRCEIPKPIWCLFIRFCPWCKSKLSKIRGYDYLTIYECRKESCGYEWARYYSDW